MSFAERVQEVREGFQRAFWVANISELFERLAYYGQQAVLAIFLREQLHFTERQTGDLLGYFGGVVWFLPILGGTLADRFGFRRSLSFAYLVLSFGYFLMGSLSSAWMGPVRSVFPLYWLVLAILTVPALGPSIVKPCVVGTTARASTEKVRSLGYSIYYTLVNVGGTLGPIVAYLIRDRMGWGIENVFRVSALSVFLMFIVTVVFFKEPRSEGEKQVASVIGALKNMFMVLTNWRFMLFLVIFSGFWVVFWQEFIALPLYVRTYVYPDAAIDLLLSIDALTVILFQLVVSHVTRKIPAFRAMTLGLLISSISWLLLASHTVAGVMGGMAGGLARFHLHVHPASLLVALALVVLALGEITQSPRYYEYVSRLAPSGQQGTYMGFAFLPIAIGFVVAGVLGGRLVHYFGEVLHRPNRMWWVISGVGIACTLLMWIYDRVFAPGREETSRQASGD